MPFANNAVWRRVLTHWTDPRSVGERDATNGERTKELRQRTPIRERWTKLAPLGRSPVPGTVREGGVGEALESSNVETADAGLKEHHATSESQRKSNSGH
jgi:hypothetical protein